MLSFSVTDAVGLLGAFLIVSAYFLLQVGWIKTEAVSFSVVNGVGAAGIIISLLYEFNLSAMVIEVFWLAISVYGIYRALRLRRKATSDPTKTGDH